MTYMLSVVKNLALIDYNMRLASYRELKAMMTKYKLEHASQAEAAYAARVISQHPLVTSITITREKPVSVWQHGRKL